MGNNKSCIVSKLYGLLSEKYIPAEFAENGIIAVSQIHRRYLPLPSISKVMSK